MAKFNPSLTRRGVLLASTSALLSLSPIVSATGIKKGTQRKKPLKIGVLTDMSSIYSVLSGMGSVTAAQMAVKDFGASASSSAPVDVIYADHQNKPDVASSIARRWYDEEGVDVIIGVPDSAVALAVRNIAVNKNKVMIASAPSSTALTDKACSPNTIQWTYDTYALATGTSREVVASGGKKWFLLTVDYAFGHAMQKNIKDIVGKLGGKVVGDVLTPINTQDFSSYLLQAQASNADVIALVNAGGDTIRSVKQASEFGIPSAGKRLVAMVLYLTDVHSLGLKVAQGLQFTGAFYWDLNNKTRSWSKRFAKMDAKHNYPTEVQAGAYASTLHYLRAAHSIGSASNGKAVVDMMKKLPTSDPLFGQNHIRQDGLMIHPMYLFQVKKPGESTQPWDYYKKIETIPADKVWPPLSQEHNCALAKT